jgi:hypothetical protein
MALWLARISVLKACGAGDIEAAEAAVVKRFMTML